MAYKKQNFVKDQVLEAEHLNHIEAGIEANEKALAEKQPKGNYLTEHQQLKTINGQSIVGVGNLEIAADNSNNRYLIPSPVDKAVYAGKKIVCIGDSVTQGVGASPNYVTNLGTELGATMVNHGLSGTVLCTGGHRTCNIGKLSAGNLSGANIVLILMGVNDWDQAKEGYYSLGDITTDDTTTIYGAMKMWCDRIMELKQNADLAETKFYFMTPPITSWNNSMSSTNDWSQSKKNIHGYIFRDLCQAIIDVCDMYYIPVIDLNLYSGIYYNSAEDENATIYGGDGIHPNTAGHELMTDCIIRMLEQNPEYASEADALKYSLNYLLAQVAKENGTEISYPVNAGEKVEVVVPVTNITLSESVLSLAAGSTHTVAATLAPANTTQTSVVWSSSNETVAKVNGGVITALAEGSATITCKSAENASVSATVSLTVTAAASTDLTALLISDATYTTQIGNKKSLSVSYAPNNTTQTGVEWESSDESVATVKALDTATDGSVAEVTAVGVGQCYITAKSTVNSSITAQCFFTTTASEDTGVDDSVKALTFATASDTSWNATTGLLTSTANPNEPLLNNNGTSNTAVLNQSIGKGQEIEVQFDTTPATTYSSANSNSWSIMTVGLDRANDIANVAKDSGYKFPQPDVHVYFDHPGKEQMSGSTCSMFTPGRKLVKNTYNTCVHDAVNAGLRVIFKRDADGLVSITANGVDVPVSTYRGKISTIDLAEAADNLYFVVSGLSSTTSMQVKYYGDLREA